MMYADLSGANLRCANLSEASLDGVDPGSESDFQLANIHGVKWSNVDLSKFAEDHGAIDITDEQWIKWREASFSIKYLKTIVGGGFQNTKAATEDDDFCNRRPQTAADGASPSVPTVGTSHPP